MSQVLDRRPDRQRHYYDPGVGTLPEPQMLTRLGMRASELFGLAFGAGLIAKVEEAYSYLMDIWGPDDRVFLFGFSRGAYTVRVLAGLLHGLGLLPRGSNNMVPYVMRLFESVRGAATSFRHRSDARIGTVAPGVTFTIVVQSDVLPDASREVNRTGVVPQG